MMIPWISREGDDYGVLKCPHCLGEYLHHAGVEVYEREGGEDGLSRGVVIGEGLRSSPGDPAQNPSPRRDGIILRFWCEMCGEAGRPPPANYRLAIVQHKGRTLMRWLD